MSHWYVPLLVVTLLSAPYSCARQSHLGPEVKDDPLATTASHPTGTTSDGAWTYQWSTPDTLLELDHSLREISGLSSVADSALAAIQDEKGRLYFLSLETGEILDTFRFSKDGDYEGVEVVGDTAWVVRSDGNLFASSISERSDGDRYKNDLKVSFDIEGLAAHDGGRTLLLAAKELARDERRVIFSVDVATRRLIEDKIIYVSLRDVGTALDLKKKIADRFKPSAIAVHPHSGQIYILSSNIPAVVVLDGGGTVISATRLDSDVFPQPEGLAFLSDGTAYVASEGSSNGYLARFSPRSP